MCQSLIYHGFKKIIIINGHREAILPPIKIAATRLRNKTGAFLPIIDPFYFNYEQGKKLRKSKPGGIGHAEELESSHMFYIHPYLCDSEKVSKNIPGNHNSSNTIHLSENPKCKRCTHVSRDNKKRRTSWRFNVRFQCYWKEIS